MRDNYPCYTCGYMVDPVRQWCPMCLAFRMIDDQPKPEITDEGADTNIVMNPRIQSKGEGKVTYNEPWLVMKKLTTYQCPLCAALTQDSGKHMQWHQRRNKGW